MSLQCIKCWSSRVLTRTNLLATLATNTRYSVRELSRSALLGADKVQIQDHSLKVPSFGGVLWVNTNFKVKVAPINSLEDMRMDKALVKVYSGGKEDREKVQVDVKQEGHKLTVNGTAGEELAVNDNLSTLIQVPLVHNVNVIGSGDADVTCCDMVESNYCHLTSDEGQIVVSRVKTANLIVQSEGGDIFCKGAIQGSISIASGDGNVVNDKRFLGPTLDITTDTGDIRVASCYSDQSKFSTNTGNLFLRNIHNESYVAVYEKGNVTMQGVDGCTNVFVKNGDVDIQVSHAKHESRIHVEEGDIQLKVSDTHPVKVCVTANDIVLDANFGKYGKIITKDDSYKYYFGTVQPDKFSPTIQVVAENGRVVIESQDWAASMGFKLPGN